MCGIRLERRAEFTATAGLAGATVRYLRTERMARAREGHHPTTNAGHENRAANTRAAARSVLGTTTQVTGSYVFYGHRRPPPPMPQCCTCSSLTARPPAIL